MSIHHSTQANVAHLDERMRGHCQSLYHVYSFSLHLKSFTHPFPNVGTQAYTTMLTMVANPMGNVPRNNDCWGCHSIFKNTDGQRVYRSLNRHSKESSQVTNDRFSNATRLLTRTLPKR